MLSLTAMGQAPVPALFKARKRTHTRVRPYEYNYTVDAFNQVFYQYLHRAHPTFLCPEGGLFFLA